MMKKTLALIAISGLAFSLGACKDKEAGDDAATDATDTTTDDAADKDDDAGDDDDAGGDDDSGG